MCSRAGLITTACIALTCTCFAEARTVTTIGDRSCALWQKGRADPTDRLALGDLTSRAWLVGFLTGANFFVDTDADVLARVDADTTAAWVDAYCTQHPSEAVSDAAIALIARLTKIQRAKAPKTPSERK
jgi:hypothetical protein